MTNFQITIVSDTVCPWCFIGARKLQKAITAYRASHPPSPSSSPDTFTTTWHPFYLNPSAPTPSINKRQYYASKFGAERTTAIFQRLTDAGAPLGISFKFGGKTGHTRDSHRLIQFAKVKGGQEVQDRVVEGLFRRYFEREEDITDRNVLVGVGREAGMEEGEVRGMLEKGEGGEVVDREVEEATGRGVSGVPNFVVQGKYEIGGAQDEDLFLEVFEKVSQEEKGR